MSLCVHMHEASNNDIIMCMYLCMHAHNRAGIYLLEGGEQL